MTVILGFAQPSHAQEMVADNNTVAGARALGMGGAQIAAVEDVTAVIHNPAALARIQNTEFQLGLIMLNKKIKTSLSSTFANGYGSAVDDFTGLGTIGIAYPVPTDQGSLVFALAYNRVKNFSGLFKNSFYDEFAFEQDGETWSGNVTNEAMEEGGIGIVSLGGAVDLSPNFSVGASIDVWTGKYKLNKRVLRNDYPGEVSWFDVTGGEDDITGWSFKPAILYHDKSFRLGAFVRFPMTFHISQKNYDELYSSDDGYFFNIHENIDPYYGAHYLDSEDYYTANYKIKAPMQVGFGLSLGTPGLSSIAFDVVYENWGEAEFEDEYDPYYFQDKYRSALNWRVGMEHKLPFLPVIGRIGYMRQPVTFKGPRGYVNTEPEIIVVNERDFMTLGLSKNFNENFRLDVGYAYGFWSEEEGAREDKESHNRLYFSLNYSMPEQNIK